MLPADLHTRATSGQTGPAPRLAIATGSVVMSKHAADTEVVHRLEEALASRVGGDPVFGCLKRSLGRRFESDGGVEISELSGAVYSNEHPAGPASRSRICATT